MAIQIGDRLPQTDFYLATSAGLEAKPSDDVFRGRKVVLVAVPGAFTPTCDGNHLPGFVAHAEAIKAKGIDAIAVTSVNDAFVLRAWARASDPEGRIEFLSDGNADFARAVGLTMDGSARGFGIRSQRYAMIVDDGVVRALAVEDAPGKADLSGAVALLARLDQPL